MDASTYSGGVPICDVEAESFRSENYLLQQESVHLCMFAQNANVPDRDMIIYYKLSIPVYYATCSTSLHTLGYLCLIYQCFAKAFELNEITKERAQTSLCLPRRIWSGAFPVAAARIWNSLPQHGTSATFLFSAAA